MGLQLPTAELGMWPVLERKARLSLNTMKPAGDLENGFLKEENFTEYLGSMNIDIGFVQGRNSYM